MTKSDPAQNDKERFSPENRRRLSGPAIRTFTAIADLWALSPEKRRRLLGYPSRSAYYRWVRKAREHGPFALSVDVLMRISTAFNIHRALGILFATEWDVKEWLHTPHQAQSFGGGPPVDLLASGSLDGIRAVRRFLDGARQGQYMAPNSMDADFQPYADDEFVFHELSIRDAQIAEAVRDNPARAAAERAAKARTEPFRREMTEKAGGMYDQGEVAKLLGISVLDVDEQHQCRKILGVPYAAEVRFPAAQFRHGSAVPGLEAVLANFGDMDPWGQLQLLVTPIKGFTDAPASIFDILTDGVDEAKIARILSLVRGWAA